MTIPKDTIETMARSVFKAASTYGFGQIDFVRLMNELMDLASSVEELSSNNSGEAADQTSAAHDNVPELPISNDRLTIRAFDDPADRQLLERWLPDRYGKYFITSCATAQQLTVEALVTSSRNKVGIVTLVDGTPIGAMAYLDHSREHQRAELRKLIGETNYRGQGLAEAATQLWISYGIGRLGLRKIYVSTLQTQLANIKLNESLGFRIEGVLKDEILIDGERSDVLRMGLLARD